ncbi:flagellar hook-associated protein FlgK [Paenibacillus protaetiae]|uniref:Flagellar hook-associated protein 1 n=1 Tax=Paenibacillus protaetiae TaxID=2509456 RepID=A0A4P6EXI1_9BACL|nr:flagellar hook-associated protein FlgK [Paenibacillus protaetiae]QAY67752.1 flagellar hook-associated protein FlgK [Paenibacillus protaetiae]
MTSTFHGIETSKRSLTTQLAAINTTGHNIANAKTEGYSRQRVNMTEAISYDAYGMNRTTMAGQLGEGVEAASITRIRENYLDKQYRDQNTLNGSWTVQANNLSQLEDIIGEPSDKGLSSQIQNFFKSWSDLAANPESASNRTIVAEYAQTLAQTFNQMSSQITTLQSSVTDQIQTAASDINSMAQSIATLNTQIKKLETNGNDANDLRDQRDLLVDQLARQGNITVADTSDGYEIDFAGSNLVTGDKVSEVTADSLGSAFAKGDLSGGEVQGLFVSRDVNLQGFLNDLDNLANTLANGDVEVTLPAGSTYQGATLAADTKVTVKGINGLHQLGFTFDNPAQPGAAIFTSSAPNGVITAASIQLNTVIKNDPSKIATSLSAAADPVTGDLTAMKGNNGLALLVADLSDGKFAFGGTTPVTIGDYYGSSVSGVGVKSKDAQRQMATTDSMLASVDATRQGVSGVSLDEEAGNLIVFQQAYSAASRFMTTLDQMLDKLINGTGVVGL